MSNLVMVQHWLHTSGCDGFLIPSTDEFLSEFPPPEGRRLRWATGFAGSVGQALVLKDKAALFLDSRYEVQARQDLQGQDIEVFDSSETTRWRYIEQHLASGQVLSIDPAVHALSDVQRLGDFLELRNITLNLLHANPIDALWGAQRPSPNRLQIIDYPACYAGKSREEKCNRLIEWLVENRLLAYFIADPEEVAWFLNVRTDNGTPEITEWPRVPIPLSRLLIGASGEIVWFAEVGSIQPELRIALAGSVKIVAPDSIGVTVSARSAKGIIGLNASRTPYRLADLGIRGMGIRDIATVTRWRWNKHANEIRSARAAHMTDDLAVIRFWAWLKVAMRRGEAVTELSAAQTLEDIRRADVAYKGISMPTMSASGSNGALPHHVPSSAANRELRLHPVYWVDSGGQYYGLSTDNTVCMSVGTVEPKHIRIHTLVVKALITIARARFPVGTHSSQIDTLARQVLWKEGMDYGHATGHGVGNFMNIHEGPYFGKNPLHPMVAPVEPGMVLSFEPALYAPNDFGVRLEAHFVCVPSDIKGFLQFEMISNLPIDPELVDLRVLDPDERLWLIEHHASVLRTYKAHLGNDATDLLKGFLGRYSELVEP